MCASVRVCRFCLLVELACPAEQSTRLWHRPCLSHQAGRRWEHALKMVEGIASQNVEATG